MKKSELRQIIKEEIQRLNEGKLEFITFDAKIENKTDMKKFKVVNNAVKSQFRKYDLDTIWDELYDTMSIKVSKIPTEDFEKTKLDIKKIYKKYKLPIFDIHQSFRGIK